MAKESQNTTAENGLPSYRLVQIPFQDKNGSNFRMDYVICSKSVGDVIDDPEIKGRIDAIAVVSDKVFPPTRPGGDMHESHLGLVASSQRFATIVAEDGGEIVGFHFLGRNRLPNTSFSVMDIHAAGVDPSYQGRKLMEISREKLMEYEQPDIVYGSTIHPAIYKAYQKLGERHGYVFFPEDENTPAWVVEFGRRLLGKFSSKKSASTLDDTFVKRDHLPMAVQVEEGGEVPYKGFDFFEQTLHVGLRDGVMMVLLKPEVVEWARNEFSSPRQRSMGK